MHQMKRTSGKLCRHCLAAAGLIAALLPSSGLAGVTAVDMTRINIDLHYEKATGWELNAHDEFSDAVYDADAVLFYVSPANRRTMPDDPNFAFIGADPGATVWFLPSVFHPTRLSVGVSAEDIADDTFASYYEPDPRVHSEAPWVKVTLVDFRGPGDISVWQNDFAGRPVLWMATADGLTPDDAVFITAGRDSDFNWAFTAPGIYEIDVVASAYLPGEQDPVCSDVVTYTFGVEAQ